MTLVCAVAALLPTGCGMALFDNTAADFVPGFRGGVAGDEPTSVLVARDILNAGGSAADAAVAGYFAMSVTLPSAASLGGGGVCLVHDKPKELAEALIFTHDGGSGSAPVPANLRGMFALHAKYGELPWRQLVSPAEGMARFGITVTKALSEPVAAAAERIEADPPLRRILSGPSGRLVRAGEKMRQIQLAATLSRIRRQPVRFFRGDFARILAATYSRAGMTMTASEIVNYRPAWRPLIVVERGNQSAEFPPTPAGAVASQLWAVLFREGYWRQADEDQKDHLLAEVTRRAYADAGRTFHAHPSGDMRGDDIVGEDRIERLMEDFDWDRRTPRGAPDGSPPPRDMGSASMVVADRFGQSVACAFTMNRAMGSARAAPGTGIVIAAPPGAGDQAIPALGLMLLRLESQNQLEYLGAATGGAVAPVALVATALRVMRDGEGLESAQNAVRLYNGAVPDRVQVEDRGSGKSVAEALAEKGHPVTLVPPMGRLNAFICPRGFEGSRSRCEMRTDPRGLGFAEGH